MTDLATGFLIIVGTLLFVSAGIGMVRFPSPYARLHAAGKATTLGLISMVLAAAFQLVHVQDGVKLLLVVLFQASTVAVAAHVMARTAHRRQIPLGHADAVDEWPQERWADE